ncbi:AraC family transcriptional regulator [Epilithonimonas sp.]|uniref:AraC family transcriptional regulator n=1 Tax=Epilithonimonas sp. TaxID=2894511 RepID=UPI00289B1D9E|nr:AraC family transcriptional regulator [Epilithonimonas sp.]
MKGYFFFIFFLVTGFVFSKDKDPKSYDYYRAKYEIFKENDDRAFLYLNPYIKKAKKENNPDELFQAYKDAVFYTKSINRKLQYADSCIDAAYKSKHDDRISASYVMRGGIYYSKLKKYRPALDEYLMAYKYAKNSSDLYLKNKIAYHLGVIKNYLGYHEEAIELFKNSVRYFETEVNTTNSKFANEIYNNQKGYLNSLHQMIVSYRHLKNTKKVDSLTDIGLLKTFNNKDFLLERGYFLKSRGISEFNNNKYLAAIENLDQSLKLMRDDFAWMSVDYFYIGKSYLALNNEDLAITNFKKIDSIFNKQEFLLPELRENYELLINHYKKKKDSEKQLYYTTQLLKADSIISKDFASLSLKIHREYDTNTLIEEKGRLETANTWGIYMIFGLLITATILVYVLFKRHKKGKETLDKYHILQEKLLTDNYIARLEKPTPIANQENSEDKKPQITETIKKDLLLKLRKFEEKKQFNQKGLTIHKLAIQFETNSNYLSHVINEQKGMNFNRYLGDLRIRHITYLLFEKNIYLNYTIDSLAKECGIASRQNFSDLFFEINGIRPTDFIRKRKQEIEDINYPKIKSATSLVSDN